MFLCDLIHPKEEGRTPHSKEGPDDSKTIWGAYPSVFPSGQEQTLGLLAPTLGQEEKGMGRRTVQGKEDGDEKPVQESGR